MHVASFAAITNSPRGVCSSLVDGVLGLPAQSEDLLSEAAEDFAGGGEGDAAAKPVKEPRVELLLELPDLRADGRLGSITGLCRFRETLQTDNLDKSVQLIEVHRRVGRRRPERKNRWAG